MAKRRATGRFYFLLILLLAVVAYFLYQQMPQKQTEATVSIATSTDTRTVDAVIVRSETVVSFDGLEKVEYIAQEGSHVSAGDAIADIYTTSYIQKEISRLVTTRENIRDYHRTLFADMTDSTLERLDSNVSLKALELKNVVTGQSDGNMENLEAELYAAMQARQEYLNTNFMDDTKLMQLYQDESKRVSSMTSWKNSAVAEQSGIVSFYFDGYEDLLTAESFTSLSADTLRKVFSGDTSIQTQKSKRTEQVYRIVSDEEWFVALISRDPNWSPVTGQQLSFQFDGFRDLVYSGTVIGVQRSGSDVIIQLRCTDPIGPLVYQRAGSAQVGVYTSGLSVPVAALFYQDSQPGVWVHGSYGVSYVPVDILSQDGKNAIIQPMQSDALYEGQTVMIY